MQDSYIQILKSGGIGVIPTDTQYGLVAEALNQDAVEKVYKIRKRSPEKPFIILISDLSDLKFFGVDLDFKTSQFLENIWPNPVSIILPVASNEFAYLHRGTNSLAFRMPDDKNLLEILQKTGPLIAPSANLEGHIYAKSISEAKNYFGDQVDFYEDQGTLESRPSTLIKIEDGKIEVLRQGLYELPQNLHNMLQ